MIDKPDFTGMDPKILAEPYQHWDDFKKEAKAWLTLRVVVTGVESSGKTTLAKALAIKLSTSWVPEYGREYTVHKYAKGDETWIDKDFAKIAEIQYLQELQACYYSHQIVIGDTDALATCVWAERYMGHRIEEVEEIGRESVPDLYILTLPDFDFVPDDIRDGEHIRGWMHEEFVKRLDNLPVPHITLGGPHESRLEAAVKAIEELKASNPRFTS